MNFQLFILTEPNKINDQFDDTDKLNIRLQKYRCFGAEKFASYEWKSNTESYSYINNYSKGDTITHKLNFVPF